MIYFLRAGKQIKIGFAATESAVRARFSTIRANSPVAVELLGVLDGSQEDEQVLHARFADHRLHSEWFTAVAEILALAATARAVAPGPAHGTRLSIRCDHALVDAVDAARGDTPRERWLRETVEQALSEAKEPYLVEQAGPGSVSSSEGVRPAAPAEQPYRPQPGPNVENIRSAVQSKRDVRPIPKGGKS